MNTLLTPTIAPLPTDCKMATARRTATKRMARGLQTAPKTLRKSRRKYDFKPNLLEQYFHMPQKEAALLLGVAVITVKRNCKRYKIEWPYRANKYKYKARNQVPLSEKGLAFMKLPLDCINEETEGDSTDSEMKNENECDTDTESVNGGDQVTQDYSQILMMLHKTPVQSSPNYSQIPVLLHKTPVQ